MGAVDRAPGKALTPLAARYSPFAPALLKARGTAENVAGALDVGAPDREVLVLLSVRADQHGGAFVESAPFKADSEIFAAVPDVGS